MADPFASLRAGLTPLDPDPAFASRLRARLERALTLPKGVTVSTVSLDPPATAPSAAVVPYVIVADARAAMAWYEDALGARVHGEPIVMADGRIGHAELGLGGAVVYLADETPESHVAAPDPAAPATVSLLWEVGDVDTAVGRAVDAGATLERAPGNVPHGRNAVLRDPYGHRWIVSAPAPAGEASLGALRPGDIGYASLWVPDVERAAAFYAAVLGWTYASGSGPEGRQVQGVTPHHGLWGRPGAPTLFLCFAVGDVDEARGRVEQLGGQAEPEHDEPYGRTAECIDDQGQPFAIYTPAPPAPPLPPNGLRHGDLSYITLEVRDSARARAFYAGLLGWRFRPGRVEDGWEVEDVVPMSGLHGGHAEGTVVPMYRVDDVATAVARVRAAGGQATDPERQPYGVTSTCGDDQGTRFHLGEL